MPTIAPVDTPDSPSPVPVPTLDEVAVGTTANDGTGDTIRAAWTKSNNNHGKLLGALQTCAPQAWSVTSEQTTDHTATVGSFCIRMDTTGGDLDVILPPAADVRVTAWRLPSGTPAATM